MRKAITFIVAVLMSLSAMGQNEKNFRVGVDASADYFVPTEGFGPVSVGLGVRVRYGRPDQWVNIIGGLRYIYGSRLQGPQVPLLVNVNLLRTKAVSAYLGGGYELDFYSRYLGAVKFQTGVLIGPHMDLQLSYKPYQEAIGLGFTYYF